MPANNTRPKLQVDSDTTFLHRTLTVIGLLLGVGLVLALVWIAIDVFLLLFAGILLAVLLRAPANWLAARTPLTENMAITLSVAGLAVTIALLAYLFAVPLAEQAGQLAEALPRAVERLRVWADQHYWTRPLAAILQDLQRAKIDPQLLGRATGVISSTVQGIASLVFVLFIGIYLATQPRLYQNGFLHLLPFVARPRALDVLDEVGTMLRRWLIGRLITMIVIGTAAGLGLWWLDVPLALTLGIVSGLLEFIPYLGPILASIPALLIAFNVDPMLALYVLILFVAIQSAENYLLSPLIEQRSVSLPPALVIFSTLVMATLFGVLGVMIASPFTATGIVVVRMLYVEDVVEQAAAPDPVEIT